MTEDDLRRMKLVLEALHWSGVEAAVNLINVWIVDLREEDERLDEIENEVRAQSHRETHGY